MQPVIAVRGPMQAMLVIVVQDVVIPAIAVRQEVAPAPASVYMVMPPMVHMSMMPATIPVIRSIAGIVVVMPVAIMVLAMSIMVLAVMLAVMIVMLPSVMRPVIRVAS